jgi:hypothetical protein
MRFPLVARAHIGFHGVAARPEPAAGGLSFNEHRSRGDPVRTRMRYAVACAMACALSAFPAIATESPPKPVQAVPKVIPAPAGETQQDRMRRCNATAKEKALKGDERKAYMSACLKG